MPINQIDKVESQVWNNDARNFVVKNYEQIQLNANFIASQTQPPIIYPDIFGNYHLFGLIMPATNLSANGHEIANLDNYFNGLKNYTYNSRGLLYIWDSADPTANSNAGYLWSADENRLEIQDNGTGFPITFNIHLTIQLNRILT